MYESKTSDLWLSEAIDIVGRHLYSDEWQGANSLKNKYIRNGINLKLIEIILSGKVACWYVDERDQPQEVTPAVATVGTFSIALMNNAFSLGGEGRWHHGKFNRADFTLYLHGHNEEEVTRFTSIEAFLRDALDKADAAGVKPDRDHFFVLARNYFNNQGPLQLRKNQILKNWKVVTEDPRYKKWSAPGRPVGT